jgi:hypothetical protein
VIVVAAYVSWYNNRKIAGQTGKEKKEEEK